MSCPHKFIHDLDLSYAGNWKPNTLLVGTFNPQWTDNNSAEWFYGRTENNFFWSVLPQVYRRSSLLCSSKEEWLHFCEQNGVVITDLIKVIKSADYEKHRKIISGFSDKAIEDNFKDNDFELVDIVGILQKNPSIKNVYLTRGAKNGLWKRLWLPVRKYCESNSINCKELMTPSGYAFYQFKKAERQQFGSLSNFILSRWRQQWHSLA